MDNDPGIADKIVVIDDPVSSLDEHRSFATVQEIRRLASQTNQVIVLSHSKPFLCRIWEGRARAHIPCSAIKVARDAGGSTLQAWDVTQDCITEHDKRHKLLRDYLANGTGDSREVAQAIRPLLEAFFRVTCPEYFPPETLLGNFRNFCENSLCTTQPILDQDTVRELREIVEFSNRFHHETNPAWDTELINETELRGFVQRALDFIKC